MPEQTQAEAAEGVLSFLKTLTPEKDVEVIDIHGNAYKAMSVLPGRAQVKVIKKLQALFEKLGKNLNDDTVNNIDAILSLLDEDSLGDLFEVFSIANPDVCVECEKAFPGVDLVDLFPLEEVAGSLVPFFARFGSRIFRGVKA